MRRREKPQADGGGKPSRAYRMLFSVMGPAQVGSLDAPVRPTPARVEVCRRCGQPQDEHILERLPDRTASRCPDPTP